MAQETEQGLTPEPFMQFKMEAAVHVFQRREKHVLPAFGGVASCQLFIHDKHSQRGPRFWGVFFFFQN